jgi:RHS repeat-associated protein
VNGRAYTETFDAATRTVTSRTPAADRVLTQTLPGGRTVALGYDANGNVTSVTPPGRPAHTFRYTPVDLEAGYTPPVVDGVTEPATTVLYNRDQQPTAVVRPDQQRLEFGYDTAGRLSAVTQRDAAGVARGQTQLAYEAATGRLASLTAADGRTLTFGYDGPLVSRVTAAGGPAGTQVPGEVRWTYDPSFRLATEAVNGQAVTYGYDADSLVTQAGALSLTRDPQTGFLRASTLGAVADSRTYTPFGEPQSYAATVGGTAAYAVSYVRDALGRITEKTETLEGVTTVTGYGYDAAGRLEVVSTDGVETARYTYDANGNRLSATTADGTVTGSYDKQDRLTTYGGTTYTYTANGELRTKTDASGATTYTYDLLGNLTRGRAGWQAGHRIPDRRAEYGSNALVPDYMLKGGLTYRILSDHLGSPRLVVDAATGAVVQRADYDAWGNVLAGTNPGFQPFGFAGGLHDCETALVRFGARDYDPQAGRWTAKDPIRFTGSSDNLYAYAFGDSVNRIDPDGRDPEDANTDGWLAAGAAVAVIEPTPVGEAIFAAAFVTVVAVEACRTYLSKDQSGPPTAQATPERHWRQDKPLTPGDIDKMKKKGIDPHDLKGGTKSGQRDLYKDKAGNVYVKPKGGHGPGEPTGINIKNL